MPRNISLKEVEGRYISPRLLSLKKTPIQGNFDLTHIQTIHQYLFQDLGRISESYKNKYRPGEFRQELPTDKVHVKTRYLREWGRLNDVVYSNMDKLVIQETAAYLKDALKIDQLKQMDIASFSKRMANIYAHLDFLHPFEEGNSRTLREFTREVSLAAGYDLHWEKTNTASKSRDILYIARDIAVNKIALSVEKDEYTRKEISHYLHALESMKTISLQGIIEGNVEKLGMEKNAEMNAAEIKEKIEAQKRVSMAMRKAIAAGSDTFDLDDKHYVKKGNVFIETIKDQQQSKDKEMSPKEKLQAQMAAMNANKSKELNL